MNNCFAVKSFIFAFPGFKSTRKKENGKARKHTKPIKLSFLPPFNLIIKNAFSLCFFFLGKAPFKEAAALEINLAWRKLRYRHEACVCVCLAQDAINYARHGLDFSPRIRLLFLSSKQNSETHKSRGKCGKCIFAQLSFCCHCESGEILYFRLDYISFILSSSSLPSSHALWNGQHKSTYNAAEISIARRKTVADWSFKHIWRGSFKSKTKTRRIELMSLGKGKKNDFIKLS